MLCWTGIGLYVIEYMDGFVLLGRLLLFKMYVLFVCFFFLAGFYGDMYDVEDLSRDKIVHCFEGEKVQEVLKCVLENAEYVFSFFWC